MVAIQIFVVVLVASTFTSCTSQEIATRMLNGIPADTMRRFPHHVSIQPLLNGLNPDEMLLCGGSILNERWILTSIRCLGQGHRLQLDFQRLHKNQSIGSYSAVVNNDDNSVYKYPTEYDDIALIKMPFRIIFSDLVRPITISSQPPSQMEKKLAVLPGFDYNGNNGDQLTYAMLSVASNAVCLNSYSSQVYDEFLQFCAKPWGNSRNSPCVMEFGSGLVANWPARPQLIGLYSVTSYDCGNGSPTVYTNLVKYQSWIDSVIYDDVETFTPTPPTTTTTTTTSAPAG